ncbi:amidase family protein [Pseudonocardia sp. ICBG162]|uniref:amidase family protein n=1 Tax=Pseudonocardia sp. ICBG162 TaxID=2846761 RepID=UPI001CF701B3|nr:amidase family protein [Pseudonocardia sp. ICBG162]
MEPEPDVPLVDRPAVELAALVAAREVSSRELTRACLERIDAVNGHVNAVVTLDADGALAAAAAADDRLVRSGPDGPLHGLPALHKDTHLTVGMRTTHGSPLMARHVPRTDDLVVARMAAAGAIRLGKTNTPEWAAGSHTVNPVFGATHNPYRPGHSAGGSSGGAAAALACGMAPLAEGSDMGGSLRNPASLCNVVGLRPTPGRVPSYPAPLSRQVLAVQGPMGRTVADVALLLSVLAGPDPRAPLSLDGPFVAPRPDVDLRGLRVAWAPDLGGRIPVDPGPAAVLADVPGVFTGAIGAEVTADCPDLDEADDVFTTLRAWQFLIGLGPVVDAHPGQVKATIHGNVDAGRRLTVADLTRAHLAQSRLHEVVADFFTRYDVLACPAVQVEPFPVEEEYPDTVAGVAQPDYLGWMRSATLISATGCPALSVPAGFTAAGSPVGLQLVAAPRAETRLLEVAAAFEAATGHGRVRP